MVIEILGAAMDRAVTRMMKAAAAVIVLACVVVVASLAIGRDPTTFLLDRDLGGRVTNLQNDLEMLSTSKIGWDSESIYAAAYLAFGPAGVAVILAIWTIPVLSGGSSRLQMTCRLTMLVYLLIGMAEGAFVLVPTQAVYWSVAAIAMCPAEQCAATPSIVKERMAIERSRPAASAVMRPLGPTLR
jgi:hypothetical protein